MPITLQTLKELLTAPNEVITKVAKSKSTNESIVMLTMNWLLLSVAFSFPTGNYSLIPAILVSGIIGTLFAGFLLHIGLTIAGGRGDFTSILSSLTYPFFGAAFSSLIVSALFIWSGVVAVFIGTILFILYFTTALTGMFRLIKETYKLDMITIWIVTSLVLLAALASVYLLSAFYILKLGTPLTSLQNLGSASPYPPY
jgi:hypothetical protein